MTCRTAFFVLVPPGLQSPPRSSGLLRHVVSCGKRVALLSKDFSWGGAASPHCDTMASKCSTTFCTLPRPDSLRKTPIHELTASSPTSNPEDIKSDRHERNLQASLNLNSTCCMSAGRLHLQMDLMLSDRGERSRRTMTHALGLYKARGNWCY